MGDPKILETDEDVLSTLHSDGKRRWMYPTLSRGKFLKNRLILGWGLIVFFLALPIVKIGGKPAIFLDVLHREFTFFGITLYPTDTILLMLASLLGVASVILFTAVFGRVWCGWACPQTVYMEFVYRPIEVFFEGKPMQRKKRDDGPLTGEKFARKTGKYLAYTVVSFGLANTFVAYFASWAQLGEWMSSNPVDNWGFFVMMAGTTGLMVFNFGYFREQMCTIACPYARIQSVLQDRDSLVVSYDPGRGETRGRRNKKQRETEKSGGDIGMGDCVDCGACVRTCPTGIDIREGLQMECIGCTQCIDACDHIMVKTNKPVGLIRYTSENELEGKPAHIARPRTFLYSAILLTLGTTFVYLLLNREPVDVNIVRAVGAPYTMLGDKVMNRVRIRVQNRSGKDATFTINVTEPAGAEVKMIGAKDFEVQNGKTKWVEAFILTPNAAFTDGQAQAVFDISNDHGQSTPWNFTLLGP